MLSIAALFSVNFDQWNSAVVDQVEKPSLVDVDNPAFFYGLRQPFSRSTAGSPFHHAPKNGTIQKTNFTIWAFELQTNYSLFRCPVIVWCANGIWIQDKMVCYSDHHLGDASFRCGPFELGSPLYNAFKFRTHSSSDVIKTSLDRFIKLCLKWTRLVLRQYARVGGLLKILT